MNMNSPLVKIPFALAATYGVTASLTNPSAPLEDHERRPNVSKTTRFMHYSTKYMYLMRGAFWTLAGAEIVAILAAQKPDSEIAQRILKLLMRKGSVDALRLTKLSMAGSATSLIGCWIRLKCFSTLREFFTFEISIRDGHRLITSGPYGYVRHPAYTGSTTVFAGLCCWYLSRGSWVRESGFLETLGGRIILGSFAAIYTNLCISLLRRMPEEDRLMKASFGKEWEEWARRVPYWIIPGIL